MISENELWLLSFYRVSEISGALFFGRLARSMRPSSIQADMTKHFSDEAMHAWYWTDCIERLGAKPLKLDVAYQDQYLVAAGMPVDKAPYGRTWETSVGLHGPARWTVEA
jgi:hypothetical protein